jgi:Ca2+-binding EF-hand superfamily protein
MVLQMDPNETGQLERQELGPLTDLIGTRLPQDSAARAKLFEELQRSTLSRSLIEPTSPLPPRIPGPVTHFRRLDVRDDGTIDVDDLRELLAPARLDVRSSTVLAALDRDGDGRLSEVEFDAALGKGARSGQERH